ncbi:hypothetical protein TWF694_009224 [Orbilia ellipsospora]|uniref:DUF7029 domain-containing protein n=1 Tax=Orbilia ellipsospora TaxID=2528407 RepID=A0AAV9XE99_9PEZI
MLRQLLFTLAVFGSQVHSYTEAAAGPIIKVAPIRREYLYPHLARRSPEDVTGFDLKHQVKLTWAQVHDGQRVVFDMDLSKPDPEHPLLALEDLDDLTKSITCRQPEIELEFRHEKALRYAINKWDWINEKESDYFYLIANHDGCGPDAERHPYKVVKVHYDFTELRAILTTEEVTWRDVAGNHKMSFSTRPHSQEQSVLSDANLEYASQHLIKKRRISTRDSKSTKESKQGVKTSEPSKFKQGFKDVIDTATEKPNAVNTGFRTLRGIFRGSRLALRTIRKAARALKQHIEEAPAGPVDHKKQVSHVFDKDLSNDLMLGRTMESAGESSPPRIQFQLTNTTLKGRIDFDSSWTSTKWTISKLVVTGHPVNFRGNFGLKFQCEADIPKLKIEPQMVMLGASTFAIGPMTVGPHFRLAHGLTASLKGAASFVVNREFTYPNDAVFNFYGGSRDEQLQSNTKGFKDHITNWNWQMGDVNLQGDIGYQATLGVGFGMYMNGSPGFEIVPLPTIRADLVFGLKAKFTAGRLDSGDCPRSGLHSEEIQVPGVKMPKLLKGPGMNSQTNAERTKDDLAVKLALTGSFDIQGGAGLEKTPWDFMWKIYEAEKQLGAICYSRTKPIGKLRKVEPSDAEKPKKKNEDDQGIIGRMNDHTNDNIDGNIKIVKMCKTDELKGAFIPSEKMLGGEKIKFIDEDH